MPLLFPPTRPWLMHDGELRHLQSVSHYPVSNIELEQSRDQENDGSLKSFNHFTKGLFPEIDTWRQEDIISLMIVTRPGSLADNFETSSGLG